jgi:hypothetical protein
MMNTEINHFFKNKIEIETWLNENNITNYTINNDLVVNVEGNVTITQLKNGLLPVQFGIVNGDFKASHLSLISLKGSPSYVHKLIINDNCLTSLKYCPEKCIVIIADNNYLTSLKYAPKKMTGATFFNNNKIVSLEHMPHAPVIWLNGNDKLDLSTVPISNQRFRVFYLDFSYLLTLKNFPSQLENNTYFHVQFDNTILCNEFKPLAENVKLKSSLQPHENILRFKSSVIKQIIEKNYLETNMLSSTIKPSVKQKL